MMINFDKFNLLRKRRSIISRLIEASYGKYTQNTICSILTKPSGLVYKKSSSRSSFSNTRYSFSYAGDSPRAISKI